MFGLFDHVGFNSGVEDRERRISKHRDFRAYWSIIRRRQSGSSMGSNWRRSLMNSRPVRQRPRRERERMYFQAEK